MNDGITDWEAVHRAASFCGDTEVVVRAERELQRGIGDVHSNEPGSGARYSAGKPPLHLIPLDLIATVEAVAASRPPITPGPTEALWFLGQYQMRAQGTGALHCAMLALGNPWHDCARVFDYGRAKYATWNWAKGMPWSEVIGCAARHLTALIQGNVDDPESRLPHVGHAMCNLVMLVWYAENWAEGDDRFVPLKAAA